MHYEFQNSTFDLEDFSHEIVIINTETGSYYTISGSAVSVIRWFFSTISDNQIIQLIENTFPNEISEASAFVDWLKIQGLIYAVETSEIKEEGQNLANNINNTLVFNQWVYSRFDDMSDLIRLDPIHDVSEKGWPFRKSND
jgi:CRISPR/Cas system endoribonuclease Cas6 (RAMP superfamily)